MLKCRKLTAIFALAALLCSQAHAATVTSESGTVLVNSGGGFVPVMGSVDVPPGTKIMVQPGGMALLTYPNNYTLRIGPGQVWEVQANPPGSEASPSEGDSTFGQITSQLSDNSVLLIAGGVILAGGLVLAQSFKPASP
ncbi:MAG TPA: hypothetical protein VE986_03255 [Hyphomicrobiales bacterium]|nr:hypothetical protein [Hyphomicrobiales bacterium]